MKTLWILLTVVVYQVHGQIPGKTQPGDSNSVVRPNQSPIIPGPQNFSDSVIHELLKIVPNDDRGKHDDMPVARPNRDVTVPMPTSQPDNAFYRSSKDPSNVVRATLDNMPIYGYDTTAQRSPAIRRIRPKR